MNRKVFWGRFLVALKKIAAVQLRLKRHQKTSRNLRSKKVTNSLRIVKSRKVGAVVAIDLLSAALC